MNKSFQVRNSEPLKILFFSSFEKQVYFDLLKNISRATRTPSIGQLKDKEEEEDGKDREEEDREEKDQEEE